MTSYSLLYFSHAPTLVRVEVLQKTAVIHKTKQLDGEGKRVGEMLKDIHFPDEVTCSGG